MTTKVSFAGEKLYVVDMTLAYRQKLYENLVHSPTDKELFKRLSSAQQAVQRPLSRKENKYTIPLYEWLMGCWNQLALPRFYFTAVRADNPDALNDWHSDVGEFGVHLFLSGNGQRPTEFLFPGHSAQSSNKVEGATSEEIQIFDVSLRELKRKSLTRPVYGVRGLLEVDLQSLREHFKVPDHNPMGLCVFDTVVLTGPSVQHRRPENSRRLNVTAMILPTR